MSGERPDLFGLPTHLRLVAPLGTGGSATVWRTRDTRRGRDVALKVVASARDDVSIGERLEREVRALARLHGVPGVVGVLECGLTDSGTAWIVTELLPGGSFTAHLGGGGIGPDAAVLAGAELAATLSEVHGCGIAHGDITPSNVLLDGAGRACLIDFGLARLAEEGGLGGCTPAYAAPERLRGAPPSAASDVYALAATTLSVACGHPYVVGVDDDDVPVAVLRDALSERPSQRPSAAELASGLGRRAARAPRWWQRLRS